VTNELESVLVCCLVGSQASDTADVAAARLEDCVADGGAGDPLGGEMHDSVDVDKAWLVVDCANAKVINVKKVDNTSFIVNVCSFLSEPE